MTGKPPGVWEPSSTASICASPLTWKGGYNTVQHMGTTEEVRNTGETVRYVPRVIFSVSEHTV